MDDFFPLTSVFDPGLVRHLSIGNNVLYSAELLLKQLPKRPYQRVLDLGSGYALSSVFLSQQLHCEVWAIDKYIDNNEIQNQLKELNADKVFPLKLPATSLPFPFSYFDAIICINAYSYFGTDDKFVPYISQFLKPEGILAVTDICFVNEINTVNEAPEFVKKDFYYYWQHIHSLGWWKNKWEKTGLVNILESGHFPETSALKKEYMEIAAIKGGDAFSNAIAADADNIINYFFLVAQKNELPPFIETY